MAEFEIGGIAYRSDPLGGVEKLLLARRLMPLALALGKALPKVSAVAAVQSEAQALEAISKTSEALMPAACQLAALSDDDVNFVLNTCLEVTQRRTSVDAVWVPVRQRGVVQHREDDTFKVLLQIAMQVIGENFGETCRSLGIDVIAIGSGAQLSIAKVAGHA